MRIWALSDLHLSLGGDKPMDVFGEHWADHHLRMAAAGDELVADEDIVLSPGDFSWALKPAEAAPDFAWLAERPGRKILIKGNHDYWWPKSKAKLAALLPPRTMALKKTACRIGGLGFFGARGGDFAPLTRYGDERSQEQIDRALDKEFTELERSLTMLQELEAAGTGAGPLQGRVCLFHYPPIPPGQRSSRFHELSSLQIFDSGDIDLEREFLDAVASLEAGSASPWEEARSATLEDASETLKTRLKDLQK